MQCRQVLLLGLLTLAGAAASILHPAEHEVQRLSPRGLTYPNMFITDAANDKLNNLKALVDNSNDPEVIKAALADSFAVQTHGFLAKYLFGTLEHMLDPANDIDQFAAPNSPLLSGLRPTIQTETAAAAKLLSANQVYVDYGALTRQQRADLFIHLYALSDSDMSLETKSIMVERLLVAAVSPVSVIPNDIVQAAVWADRAPYLVTPSPTTEVEGTLDTGFTTPGRSAAAPVAAESTPRGMDWVMTTSWPTRFPNTASIQRFLTDVHVPTINRQLLVTSWAATIITTLIAKPTSRPASKFTRFPPAAAVRPSPDRSADQGDLLILTSFLNRLISIDFERYADLAYLAFFQATKARRFDATAWNSLLALGNGSHQTTTTYREHQVGLLTCAYSHGFHGASFFLRGRYEAQRRASPSNPGGGSTGGDATLPSEPQQAPRINRPGLRRGTAFTPVAAPPTSQLPGSSPSVECKLTFSEYSYAILSKDGRLGILVDKEHAEKAAGSELPSIPKELL
ncbi:hypothetical protein IWQ60_008642 [Tieghemiomyces parasiticus]|uniref:Uncharacterized protein n=1 Tax=Tieghemiomyces parasiticus TaxID=78921 RepID=A0A9W7ZX01_9FUNG|nr:hypothetical protein IWQ60_008642 [Tieghemiomyces parasiticus]